VPAGRLGERGRLVGQRAEVDSGHPAGEDLPDLLPVVVDRRHQDVRRGVVGELHDQFGEVGLHGRDPRLGQRLVEPDLLGGHRLDLDDLGAAGTAYQIGDQGAGLGGVPGPVHGGAGGGGGRLELFEQFRQAGEDVVLDRRTGGAELGPVRYLPDHP